MFITMFIIMWSIILTSTDSSFCMSTVTSELSLERVEKAGIF